MKKLTWFILAAYILAFPSLATSGLPPTRSGGQSDALSTTFDFQAPLSQVTKTSGTKALIETGNYNLLKNPGFEASNYSLGWTGSFTSQGFGSGVALGEKSLNWDVIGAAETFASDQVTIPAGYYGKNGELTCAIRATSPVGGSFVVWNGSTAIDDQTSSFEGANSTFRYQTINFVFPSSGTIGLFATSGSPYGTITFDDCYLGLARNVFDTTISRPTTSFTPTGSWTTNTTYSGRYWQIGDRYHYQVQVALTGNPNSASLTINYLASGFTIDTAKMVATTTDGRIPQADCRLRAAGTIYKGEGYYNGNNLAVTVANVASTYPFTSNATQALPGTFTNGDVVICQGDVPIVSQASTVVTQEQQRTPKVSNYLSGSGTHTWSTGVTYAVIEMIGGGGGGGGAGTSSTAGGTGGTTTFDGVSAPGGTGGGNGTGASSGSPGAATAVPCTTNETFTCRGGAPGAGGTVSDSSASALHAPGGAGGQSRFGGAGEGRYETSGLAAQANTGSGGAGGAGDAGTFYAGAGGTVGADIIWKRDAPTGSASYSVGAAGAAGTGTRAGGAGGSGYIRVTEYFGATTALLANSVSTFNKNGSYAFGAGVTSADCTSTPCTLNDGSTPGVTITRASTGIYSLNYAGLGITKTPTCAIGHNRGSGDYKCDGGTATTTSQTIFCYQNTTGSTWVAVDLRPSAVCFVNR